MKHLPAFLCLTAALCLSIPATGLSRDYHHHHSRGHYQSYSSHSNYCPPVVSYRSYRPSISYYSSPYYSAYPYGYSPYSYSRPSLGISLSTGPSYATYTRSVRSNAYDDDLAEDVQRALARRGYYRGEIDGEVGPGTRGAIREYQYRNRLEVTGRIDRSLLRSLNLS